MSKANIYPFTQLIPFTVTAENRHKIGYKGIQDEILEIPETFYDNETNKLYQVSGIDKGAFAECSNLKSVIIPNTISEICEFAFVNCHNLQKVILGNGLTRIWKFAFSNCKNINEVIIPPNVTCINRYDFEDSEWIKQFESTYIDSNNLLIINGILVDGSHATGDVFIPEIVTSISEAAFLANDQITSVKIPDSITEIGDSTFSNCKSLRSVKLPNTITNIDDWAFNGCTKLESITIPNSVINIGKFAFNYCISLSDVNLSNNISSIGGNVFTDTPWLTNKQKENPLVIVNNMLVDGRTCTGDIVIPDNVKYIADQAFYGSGITSIEIPNSVITIGNNVFSECKKLFKVNIPDGVISIGRGVFYNCILLHNIIIPNSVINISDNIFKNTPWLDNKYTKPKLTIINDIIINGSDTTGDIVIPDNVKGIAINAFYESEITSINISKNVENISYEAFAECPYLKFIDIQSDYITSIPANMCRDCTSLTTINIGKNVRNIYRGAFKNCPLLTKVRMPKNVDIDNTAFDNINEIEFEYYENN